MNIRIATVTSDKPLELADDERILERQSVYGEGAPAWNLLIAKGPKADEIGAHRVHDPQNVEREARADARADQMRQAFAAGFAAFAAAINKPTSD